MIGPVYSNMAEYLLEDLVCYLQQKHRQDSHPLDPVKIVVPNRNLLTWTRLEVTPPHQSIRTLLRHRAYLRN